MNQNIRIGQLESALARELRNSKLKRAVLDSVIATGTLSVAVVAPNALSILKPLLRHTRQEQYRARKAFSRLLDAGLLALEKTSRGSQVKLTEKGRKALEAAERRNYKISIPKKWDGKWRVIIFDIPEKRKSLRNHMRTVLMRIGFVRLQDSVWIYPYNCEELVVLLKADFRLGKDLLYLIVDKVENDKHLRVYFELNS